MKYPKNTRQGMARRKNNIAQFNPHSGEQHTAKFIAAERKLGFRRRRG